MKKLMFLVAFYGVLIPTNWAAAEARRIHQRTLNALIIQVAVGKQSPIDRWLNRYSAYPFELTQKDNQVIIRPVSTPRSEPKADEIVSWRDYVVGPGLRVQIEEDRLILWVPPSPHPLLLGKIIHFVHIETAQIDEFHKNPSLSDILQRWNSFQTALSDS